MRVLSGTLWVLAVLYTATCHAGTLPRTALILDQSSAGVAAFAEISATLRAEFTGAPAAAIVFYEERLDLNRFGSDEHQARLHAFVKDKYRGVPIGVLVAMGPAALDFALNLRAGDWAGLPIVFVAVPDGSAIRAEVPAAVVGRTLKLSFAHAVRAANLIVPNMKRLALVGDPLERQTFRGHFKTEPAFLHPGVELIDLTGLPMADVKRRAATLPDDAAIYYTAINVDGDRTVYTPPQALQQIALAANRPIIVDVDTYIGLGAVGGIVALPGRMGQEAAQLVRRLLDGEDVWTTPVLTSEALQPVFDWRELQRWHVSAENLPDGSEIRFRAPSDWERNRWRVLLFVTGLLLQSVLIAWLLYVDRRRSVAESHAAMLHGELAHSNRVATAGALTASLAHEIRQPLTAIVSSASAGLNFLNHKTPNIAEVRDALQHIINEGLRADSVIANVRAMFRKDTAARITCDVNKLMREVLVLADHRLRMEGVTVRTRLGDHPPPIVTANPVQLQQVFLNLIMNAVEAMMTVPPANRVVDITTRVRQRQVLVLLEDSGPGVAPEILKRLFDPFFTTKPGGMGMGLAICKSIVEAHDGQLTAAQRPGGGAAFSILLPVDGGTAR